MTLLTEPSASAFTAAAKAILDGEPYGRIPLTTRAPALIRSVVRGLFYFDEAMPREYEKRYEVHVPRNPEHDEPDDGIIRRSNEKSSDQKLMLHVRPDLARLYFLRGVVLYQPWYSWIYDAIALRNTLFRSVCALAHAIDQECPELRLVTRMKEAERSTNSAVLRVNKYEAGSRGYAKLHTDRDAISLSAGESPPSLYFLKNGERYECGETPKTTGIAFAGNMLEKASDGRVNASLHGTHPIDSGESRWSVVLFGNMAL